MSDHQQSVVAAWLRRPGESPRAYEAAMAYFEMRAGRSISAVSQRLGKHVSLLERWSKRWGWVERAAAFDEHLAREAQIAREQANREYTAKWQARAQEKLEEDYQRGKKIESKIDNILDLPLISQTSSDGKIILKPVGHKLSDVAPLAGVASRLINSAIQQAIGSHVDERAEVEWTIEDYGTPESSS